MAQRHISIDEKIERQEQLISQEKDKYEADVAELERLMSKRNDTRKKEFLMAVAASSKSYEEVMEFLNGDHAEE